ncbi:MAG: lysophospholipase [Candidatus Eremiobacteraeota bacterium]|nr:lysophospholipase [Candidatus Eremiobacteraeota bacterium]
MRPFWLGVSLVLAWSVPAAAQTGLPPVHANAIIPQPPPSAPLASWVAAEKRTTMSIDVDGATLRGWSYAAADPALPTVLLFNGNAATIAGGDSFYRTIAALGARVVVFDYRGYGFSGGSADVTAFERDALAVYDAVAKDAGRAIAVYGFSLGAPIAAYVAAHRPVAGLILAAAMANAREELPVFAMQRGAPQSIALALVAAPDAEAAFDDLGFVAHSTAPLLVLHGTSDEAVPIAQGREVLAASAATRKRFVEIPNVDHNGTVSAPASLEAVRQFLASLRV